MNIVTQTLQTFSMFNSDMKNEMSCDVPQEMSLLYVAVFHWLFPVKKNKEFLLLSSANSIILDHELVRHGLLHDFSNCRTNDFSSAGCNEESCLEKTNCKKLRIVREQMKLLTIVMHWTMASGLRPRTYLSTITGVESIFKLGGGGPTNAKAQKGPNGVKKWGAHLPHHVLDPTWFQSGGGAVPPLLRPCTASRLGIKVKLYDVYN